jgi:putative DNA primase/helicase
MLANNEGKKRLRSEIVLRSQHNWRVLILSTGEIDIATKVAEVSKKAFAGMEVRFVSLPANCNTGHGIFEDLHGFKNGDQLSKYLKDACGKYYGIAIQKYLELITNDIEAITAKIKQIQQEFKMKYIPENSSGQVARVASRFGLIAAAGELAIGFGILPLAQGDAVESIAKCFKAWGNERGNTQDLEQKIAIAQVKSFLEKYGDSKFINIGETYPTKPVERFGYKQKFDGVFHYYIFPEIYKNEVCKGLNYKQVTKYLLERNLLVADAQGRSVESKHLPDIGKVRVYHITGEILA